MPPDRRALRCVIAALGLLALACGRGGAPPERIVLVSIDTLRADRVGSYGAARAHTPTLDRLAAEGWRWEVALSPVPLTLPAHATMLTGLDPDQHGVRHNSVFTLDPGRPTLPERLRAEGFATAAFVGAFVLDARFGLARGFDVYDDDLAGERRSGMVGFAERRAAEVVDAALAWAETAPPRFFLWIHFYDPHARYEPPAGFSMRFPGDPYAGEIAYADAQLGRLLEGLGRRFDLERTLVVATSDHGEALGEHGEPTHSYGIYEATQRIPLIARGPGFRGGRVEGGIARLADLAPTLLAAAGAAPFAEASGRDLRAGAGAEAWQETLATHLDFGWSALFGLRTERWKYVRAPRPELYDLAADPKETQDVAGAHPEVVRELAARVEARLAAAAPLRLETAPGGEDRARLEALGYVVPASGARDPALAGPDPKDEIGLLFALDRAGALAAAGRHAEAYAVLAERPAAGPTLHATRAMYALNAGLGEPALRDAEAALAAEPDRLDHLWLLAQAHELLGQLAEAGVIWRRIAAQDSADAAAWTGLGRSQEAGGDRAAAADSYAKALAAGGPARAEAAWRLAALRIEDGALAEGRALLGEAPKAPGPLLALRVAAAEAAAGDAPGAAARVAAALEAGPPPPGGASLAAALLEGGGRIEEALRVREEALRADPDAWLLQNEVAWSLALLGRDLERALALARAAAAAAPTEAGVLDTLATVQLRRGDAAGALATAERALRTAPQPLRGHLGYVRAAALEALGRGAAARAALAAALATPEAPGEAWRADARALADRLDAAPGA